MQRVAVETTNRQFGALARRKEQNPGGKVNLRGMTKDMWVFRRRNLRNPTRQNTLRNNPRLRQRARESRLRCFFVCECRAMRSYCSFGRVASFRRRKMRKRP